MAARSAHLPDTLVGVAPMLLDEIHQDESDIPGIVGGIETIAAGDVEDVEDLTVDVELELIVGGVADAHGRAVLVAGQPGQLEFRKAALTGESVHGLDLVG